MKGEFGKEAAPPRVGHIVGNTGKGNIREVARKTEFETELLGGTNKKGLGNGRIVGTVKSYLKLFDELLGKRMF